MISVKQLTEGSLYLLASIALGFFTLRLVVPVTTKSSSAVVIRSASDERRMREVIQSSRTNDYLIEFMDFQCPPCRATWTRVKAFLAKHRSMKYKAMNFPLVIHPNAFNAAVTWEVGKEFGQSDRVFEDLFSGNTDLTTASLNTYLESKGIRIKLGSNDSRMYEERVRNQMSLAAQLSVNATPTFSLLRKGGGLVEIHSLQAVEKYLDGI